MLCSWRGILMRYFQKSIMFTSYSQLSKCSTPLVLRHLLAVGSVIVGHFRLAPLCLSHFEKLPRCFGSVGLLGKSWRLLPLCWTWVQSQHVSDPTDLEKVETLVDSGLFNSGHKTDLTQSLLEIHSINFVVESQVFLVFDWSCFDLSDADCFMEILLFLELVLFDRITRAHMIES